MSNVHKYLKISKSSDGTGELAFEHCANQETADREQDKFIALAQALGLQIKVGKSRKGGQPIADTTVHKDFLPGRNRT